MVIATVLNINSRGHYSRFHPYICIIILYTNQIDSIIIICCIRVKLINNLLYVYLSYARIFNNVVWSMPISMY